MFHHLKKIMLLICLFCLTSCGFHLRGKVNLAPPLQRVYLQSNDPYGQLTKNIRQYLKMSGVYLASNPNEASTILDILSDQENQQLQSVSGTQQTRQYTLTLTVTFQVTDPKGKILVEPQSVAESRPLTIAADKTLATSNEQVTLYTQMRQIIVFDMMSRLSSQEITTLLTTKK